MKRSLLVLAALTLLACRKPRPTVDVELAALTPDPEGAPSLSDDLATLAADFPEYLRKLPQMTDEAHRQLIDTVLAVSAQANVGFRATGNPYTHFAYPEPPAQCLTDGSCFNDYLAFQRREAATRYPATFSPASMAARRDALLPLTSFAAIVKAFDRRERLAAALVTQILARRPGASDPPPRIVLLETGHPAEAKQTAALADAERLLGRQVAHAVIDLRHEPKLVMLLGNRVVAGAFVDGHFRRDLTTVGQWLDSLDAKAPLPPLPARRQADLPVFDAHAHLVIGGATVYARMLTLGGVKGAVVMPLPTGLDYGGLEAANQLVLTSAPKLPGEIVPFVMLNPEAPAPLADLERLVAAGARGVKLISGHGDYFQAAHDKQLESAKMREVFAYCQAHGIPIIWHVNSHLYAAGFLQTLADYPKLQIVNPHFGGYLTYAPGIVRGLLERYPNLSFDVSFGGQVRYLRRAFEDLSIDRDAWRQLFLDYPDRFLFGVDMVVGKEVAVSYGLMLYRLYTSWLEEERFDLDFFAAAGYGTIDDEGHHVAGLRGLALPREVLAKVYWGNAHRLFVSPRPPI